MVKIKYFIVVLKCSIQKIWRNWFFYAYKMFYWIFFQIFKNSLKFYQIFDKYLELLCSFIEFFLNFETSWSFSDFFWKYQKIPWFFFLFWGNIQNLCSLSKFFRKVQNLKKHLLCYYRRFWKIRKICWMPYFLEILIYLIFA